MKRITLEVIHELAHEDNPNNDPSHSRIWNEFLIRTIGDYL